MSSKRYLNTTSSNMLQNAVNKSINTRNESPNGLKSGSSTTPVNTTSKLTRESPRQRHNSTESKTGANRSSNDLKPQNATSSSRLPIYTANGNIHRQRRHSDGHQPSQYITNNCLIHGNRDLNPIYGILRDQNMSTYVLPDKIRAIHNSHRCSNVGKSRSVPSSNLVSTRTSPASTPSTPTDSRRIAPNRNAFTPTSTPSRSGSKSSLSMASQTTRSSVQKTYYEYWPLCEVQKGLEKGDIVEGVLRINPRNYSDAYISAPEGGVDIYVGGMIDRNRAFNGDKVAVKIHETDKWKILHDTIRIHWDEWGEQFESLIQSPKNANKKEQKSVSNAQNSHNNIETIYETCEHPQSNDCVCETNGISRNEVLENQSNSGMQNDKSDVSDKIDEGEALDASNSETALPLNSNQNDSKQKKKRSRPRKKKSSNKISEKEKQNECHELSDLTPEASESTEKTRQNKSSNKSSDKTDELSQKILQIQSLKINDLMKLPFWQRCVQRTGKVVAILEENHSRQAGGRLQQMKDKSTQWALFAPNDSRVPRMRIAMKECPPDFLHHPQHFVNSLFIAKLDEWKNLNTLPNGTLVKHLGDTGDIEAESQLILIENNIEFSEFSDEAFTGLPDISDDKEWTILEEEIHSRCDLRNECVFTIDPSTARDLDDALSIKQLDEDLFEVGVHIADVSYFLKEGMPLDEIARRRTTSVYLVQNVIPMLPRILCEKLCSLNAGEDKLTFSVIWVINKDGHILEESFTRTIINSCVKLSYELAQDMIDDPNRDWKEGELPRIYGNWSAKKISECVNMLNEIAVKLRKRRFESGALRIEKLKLHFILDKETGLPSGFSSYTHRDSNRLVEEFMLLANMAVAHKIYKSFGDKAFLRCHPAPGEAPLNDFKSFCKYNNFEVDTSSSLALQQSLNAVIEKNPEISKVMALFLLKAMQVAKYICVGVESASASFHHYALNVPLYTHFTSPIRRYADVIVHRLLAASLSYRHVINDSAKDLHRLARNCNDKKLSARMVSEASSRLFLNLYIKQIGKMEEKAVVVQVYDHSFDVMLLNCGVICRVYLDQLPLEQFKFKTKQGKNQLILKWNNDVNQSAEVDSSQLTQTIVACLVVNVQVSLNQDDSTKLNAILQHPSGIFRYNQNSSLKTCGKN